MPTATSFTALTDGAGGLCNVPAFDCTIGGDSSGSISDYLTLGGYRGSTGGTPSATQIKNSFINGMKMNWNFHGVDVSGGLTGAGAFASKDYNLSYTTISGRASDPERTNYSWSISTSATAAKSKSFPNVNTTSSTPISGICTSRNFESEWFEDEGAEDDDYDIGEAESNGITAYSTSSANVRLYGVGVGPPGGYGFTARNSSSIVRAFFDNGVFVGYGVVNLFTNAGYNVSAYASGGGGEDQLPSSLDLVCSFSLGGVIKYGEVTGLNPDIIETKKITINGIPLLFQAGHYSLGGNNGGTLEMKVSGKTATFEGNGTQLDGNTYTDTRPDTSTRENYIQTITVTNRCAFDFKFKVDRLNFWSY